MGAFLLPALPGGTATTDVARIARIATHPWTFRLGWLPWQLCAVADLLLAIAMVRVRWLPHRAAIGVLVATCCAVIPDQLAQAIWVTRGVDLARTDANAYLSLEREIFPLTAGWGAAFYTIAALGWTWCFVKAGTWSRTLTVLSVPLWLTMTVAVVTLLVPEAHRPSSSFVSAANGLGFAELQLWLALVTEEVLRRARPFEPYGRLARWRHPGSGLLARIADLVANSRLLGMILEPVPEAEMRSDIEDVVYVNYLVSADRAAEFVPPGLELERLGPGGRHALFTFLTFRHNHFGFAFLGPLRKLLPPSVQTNWRVHVRDPNTGHRGIYFFTNAITATMPALAARLTTEGMPMHVLRGASVTRSDAGIEVVLDPGSGTAPDAKVSLRRSTEPALVGAWAECWMDWRDFLSYCVPQDRAMSSQPLRKRISRQEIDLGIPIDGCEPFAGTVVSAAAKAIAGDAAPLCFRVAKVAFKFSVELHDRAA